MALDVSKTQKSGKIVRPPIEKRKKIKAQFCYKSALLKVLEILANSKPTLQVEMNIGQPYRH